jgi:RNA polymerase sigma-70 factor (ECF subfamily)
LTRSLEPPSPDATGACEPADDEGAARWVEAWLEARAAGEDGSHAFRQLFDLHYRPVWRFFARRGFPHEECHDLTQETFVRVYTGMDGFRGEARFETWLFRIALNTYRKALRYRGADKRAGRELSLEDANGGVRTEAETADEAVLPMADPPRQPLDDMLGNEKRRALKRAVAELPDQMRRCVVLRIYQDLPYKEIAGTMKVSIETVKAHLFQARRRLRVALADHFEDLEL